VDRTAAKGDAGSDDLYKISYDEAVRALSDQRLEVDGVHSRTGLLLSVAAVVTSFLGSRTLESGSLSPISWRWPASSLRRWYRSQPFARSEGNSQPM